MPWIILPDKTEVAEVLEEDELKGNNVRNFYKDKDEEDEE